MPIIDKKNWNKAVEVNKDPYGKACVDVARRVMEILDENEDFNAHQIICQADDDIKAGGITGFMAGCVSSMVSQCHSRGSEFREKWNESVSPEQAKDANQKNAVLNPAVLTISTKK